jgi:parallel beta-helix repeat protein
VITRGTGDVIQGIFIENTNHIEITGNAMTGTMYNGISLSGVSSGLVSNNFVQGWVDMNSGIITRGGSSNVTMLNDVSQGGIANYQVDGPNPGYTESGTTSVAAAAIGDLSGLNAWLSHHSATTASLADPFFIH